MSVSDVQRPRRLENTNGWLPNVFGELMLDNEAPNERLVKPDGPLRANEHPPFGSSSGTV